MHDQESDVHLLAVFVEKKKKKNASNFEEYTGLGPLQNLPGWTLLVRHATVFCEQN